MRARQDEDAQRFAGRYRGDETECHFVSTFGLMKSCPVRTSARPGKLPARPWRMTRRHEPDGLIYVHPELLGGFARWVLPRIRAPFTLLTGNSTRDIRPGPVPQRALDRILAHPQFRHWHAQNLATEHPAMSVIPLGLDYHTMSIGRNAWWGEAASPVQQEAALDKVRLAAPPLTDRRVMGYSNWHFAPDNPARTAVRDALSDDVNHYQPDRLQREDSWRANADYLFTMSPRGRGMDCHRTWEAILIGSVPIVDAMPIAPVFADLPVVQVSDWSTVTPAFLAAERARILSGRFDFAPLFLAYWRRKIAGAAPPSLWMDYQTFLSTPAATLADRL